jgi:hypothetical protein
MITKELLERLQSYLTKEEAESVIPQFKKQYDDYFGCINQDSKASDILLGGFDWDFAEEGMEYWDNLYCLVKQRENN